MPAHFRSKARFAAALALPVFALAATVPADTISLSSVADTWIHSENKSDSGKGTTNYLSVGADGADPTFTARIARGLLRFDLTTLPEGAVVTSAVLKLTQALANERTGDGKIPISVYRVLQDWNEGDGVYGGPGANWTYRQNNSAAWGAEGADGAADRAADPTATTDILNNPQQWDVTSDVQLMLSGHASNYGWLVVADDGEGGDRYRFRSREAAEAQHPRLEISYVIPEPSSVALGAVGALLLLRRR